MNSIDATIRNTETKGQLYNLRMKGFVPAIVYGGKDENKKISVSKKQINLLMERENFSSEVISLKLDNNEFKVLPREISFDTVSDEPIHIDFFKIIDGSKINLNIAVKFINNERCPGLKRGGVLNIVRRKVELRCPAENIPKEIIVDLENLDIGASIKISSVKLEENIKPTIKDRDFVIATVAAPTVVKEPEKPAEADEKGTDSAGEDTVATSEEKSKTSNEDEKNKDADKKEDQKAASEKK